eukprot:1161927-Pelagomonas_calceolata.AAC.2
MLVNEARRRYPSQIKFHFGREASQIKLAEKQVGIHSHKCSAGDHFGRGEQREIRGTLTKRLMGAHQGKV